MHENARPAENMPAEGDIRGCDLLVAVEAHRADHGISGADRDDDLLDAVPLLPAGPVEVLQLAVWDLLGVEDEAELRPEVKFSLLPLGAGLKLQYWESCFRGARRRGSS